MKMHVFDGFESRNWYLEIRLRGNPKNEDPSTIKLINSMDVVKRAWLHLYLIFQLKIPLYFLIESSRNVNKIEPKRITLENNDFIMFSLNIYIDIVFHSFLFFF